MKEELHELYSIKALIQGEDEELWKVVELLDEACKILEGRKDA